MTSVKAELLSNLFGHEPQFKKHSACWPDKINLSIDSRTIGPNSIFFAMQGEIADGHDYIKNAFSKGALLTIAQKNHRVRAELINDNIIWVDNPLETFSKLACDHVQSMTAYKIALTGSNGKTTTKEMLKSAFSAALSPDHVFASFGNKNNHFGVPLSALELKAEHEVAVFEMGMNHAGEITQLCNIIKPDMGLIINISMAHEGNFSDGILGVQKAKGELFADLALRPHTHALVNLDDPRVLAESSKRIFTHRTTFGFAHDADIRILSRTPYNLALNTQEIIIQARKQKYKISCPLPGAHQATNIAAALAASHALDLPLEKACAGISAMSLTPGRLSLHKHQKGFLIINDAYNANPASMKSGIEAALELPALRRIAVVGAMGELGQESMRFHFELGELLALHFEHIFICGPLARPVVDGAKSAGTCLENIFFADSSEKLIEPLKKLVSAGDSIFIKGSLSANMALVAHALALY